jgi:hypothetical protein
LASSIGRSSPTDRERQLIAHLQAARTDVQGYENLHGYKLRFETTWLDK